jgi:hypothetical protein
MRKDNEAFVYVVTKEEPKEKDGVTEVGNKPAGKKAWLGFGKTKKNDEAVRPEIKEKAPEYGTVNARRDMEIWYAIRSSAQHGSEWVDYPSRGATELERRIHDEYVRSYGHDPIEETPKLLHVEFNRLSVMWTIAGFL